MVNIFFQKKIGRQRPNAETGQSESLPLLSNRQLQAKGNRWIEPDRNPFLFPLTA